MLQTITVADLHVILTYQEVAIIIVGLLIEGKGLDPLRLVILASFYSNLDAVSAHSYLA